MFRHSGLTSSIPGEEEHGAWLRGHALGPCLCPSCHCRFPSGTCLCPCPCLCLGSIAALTTLSQEPSVRRLVGVVWGCRHGVSAAVVVLKEEDLAAGDTACRSRPVERKHPLEPSLSVTELPERWPADLPTLPTRDPGRLADRARLARVRVTGDLHDAAFGQIRDRSPDSASGAPAGERFQADSRWLTSELGSANADALPRRSKTCWQAAPLGRPGSELNVRSTCPEVERPKRPAGD